jgi:hypothetical protein
MSPQHASLSPERWSAFSLDQQILMIANEMNRARKVLTSHEDGRLTHSYERILRLTDLTIQVQERRSLRRELLRWRDLIAELYIAAEPDGQAHDAAFRCLLRFTPEASLQIPYVLGP